MFQLSETGRVGAHCQRCIVQQVVLGHSLPAGDGKHAAASRWLQHEDVMSLSTESGADSSDYMTDFLQPRSHPASQPECGLQELLQWLGTSRVSVSFD